MAAKRRAAPSAQPAIQALLDALDEAFHRGSWHGPNLQSSIKGLSAEAAVWRPGPGRHNVHELIVHAAYWKHVVWRKLTHGKSGSFELKGNNFFTRDVANATALKADLALLKAQHAKLRSAVAALTPKNLTRKLSGRTLAWMIRGAAAHDIYHAGQIRLLRRLGEAK